VIATAPAPAQKARHLHDQATRMHVRVIGLTFKTRLSLPASCKQAGPAPAYLRFAGRGRQVRSRTMRGFKAMHKVLAHPHLSF